MNKIDKYINCVIGVSNDYGADLIMVADLLREGYFALKMLDRRSGYMTHFDYCPLTGIALDYKVIRAWVKYKLEERR